MQYCGISNQAFEKRAAFNELFSIFLPRSDTFLQTSEFRESLGFNLPNHTNTKLLKTALLIKLPNQVRMCLTKPAAPYARRR